MLIGMELTSQADLAGFLVEIIADEESDNPVRILQGQSKTMYYKSRKVLVYRAPIPIGYLSKAEGDLSIYIYGLKGESVGTKMHYKIIDFTQGKLEELSEQLLSQEQ